MLTEWQKIVDLITKISGAYVGLIMGVCHNDIEVLVASKTQGNPFHVGDREHLSNSGLYCESVISTMDKMVVPNALKSDKWNENPDLKKYNLQAYLDFPIRKPDGSPFGTICILDNKENPFSDVLFLLIERMRDLIERELKIESLYVENRTQAELLQEKVLELKHVNQMLKESEEKYKLILENTTDYIWVYNWDRQKFTYASPNVEQIRGFTLDEIISQGLKETVTPDSWESIKNQAKEAEKLLQADPTSTPVSCNEIRQARKDGEFVWVEYTAKYRYNQDQEIEIVGVSRNIDDRKRKEQEIYYISTHDYLTDTYNRSCFEQQSKHALKLKEHSQEPLSLLIIDIDYFKRVNDTFGHLAGDEILKIVSQTIAAAIRSNDILARYGGEEFIVLMPGVNLANAINAAERIRARVESTPYPYDLKITISIGVTEHGAGDTLDSMYRYADTALYNAKESGRNQIAVYHGCDLDS